MPQHVRHPPQSAAPADVCMCVCGGGGTGGGGSPSPAAPQAAAGQARRPQGGCCCCSACLLLRRERVVGRAEGRVQDQIRPPSHLQQRLLMLHGRHKARVPGVQHRHCASGRLEQQHGRPGAVVCIQEGHATALDDRGRPQRDLAKQPRRQLELLGGQRGCGGGAVDQPAIKPARRAGQGSVGSMGSVGSSRAAWEATRLCGERGSAGSRAARVPVQEARRRGRRGLPWPLQRRGCSLGV